MVKSTLSASAAAWTPSFITTSKSSDSNIKNNNNDKNVASFAAIASKPAVVPDPTPPAKNGETKKERKEAIETKVETQVNPIHKSTTTTTTSSIVAEKTLTSDSNKVSTSVWGSKASDVIKQPPTAEIIHLNPKVPTESSQQKKNTSQKSSMQGGHLDHNKRRDFSKDNRQHQQKGGQSRDEKGGWKRGRLVPLPLIKPGEGETETSKRVQRVSFEELLQLRLSFVACPLAWEEDGVGPPDECKWTDENRVQKIIALASVERSMKDPSEKQKKKSNANETAPPIEECKPLEVNDDTRWKAHVFDKEQTKDDDSDDIVLKKALLILNKLSLTKFDKLSDAFIDTGVGRNETCLIGATQLIVKKAQDEPHFAAMYASLCLKLSKTPVHFEEPGKNKKFKKMLLTECQKEFEEEMDVKISKAIEGIENEEDREIKMTLVKKHYLGHMRFIGELYKCDLISAKIMIFLLPQLLDGRDDEGDVDEEKVECFAKLMTVIGKIIEEQGNAMKDIGKPDVGNKLQDCWKKVEVMAGKVNGDLSVSNRIKFMLLDLLEMRDNGWTSRRKEESAKTISQIHKEAAQDARRSTSSSHLRKQPAKPIVDEDGFTKVVGTGSSGSRGIQLPSKSSMTNVSSSNAFASSSEPRNLTTDKSEPKVVDQQKQIMTPKDYLKKAKTVLKEFFVGGDDDDAVLSFQEIIGADLSIERGSMAFEGGVLLVLEMRQEEVQKFIDIMSRCYKEKIISAESIRKGVSDPLEFLQDVAIDAPLAVSHMATIAAAFIKEGAITFDFLLDSPEYFRTECNAARFGCKVLNAIGGNAMNETTSLNVIEKLMTDEEKKQYPSVQEFLDA
jgi:translation initiation factor 4G